jgi:hypothetical protein
MIETVCIIIYRIYRAYIERVLCVLCVCVLCVCVCVCVRVCVCACVWRIKGGRERHPSRERTFPMRFVFDVFATDLLVLFRITE